MYKRTYGNAIATDSEAYIVYMGAIYMYSLKLFTDVPKGTKQTALCIN